MSPIGFRARWSRQPRHRAGRDRSHRRAHDQALCSTHPPTDHPARGDRSLRRRARAVGPIRPDRPRAVAAPVVHL